MNTYLQNGLESEGNNFCVLVRHQNDEDWNVVNTIDTSNLREPGEDITIAKARARKKAEILMDGWIRNRTFGDRPLKIVSTHRRASDTSAKIHY